MIKKRKLYKIRKGEYNIPKILKRITRLARRLGRYPYWRELAEEPDIPSRFILIQIFGNRQKIVKLIGLPPPPRLFKFWINSKEEFKEAVLKYYRKYKKVPTNREFRKAFGFPSLSFINQRDVTWNQLLHECGLPIHSNEGPKKTNRIAEVFIKDLLIRNKFRVEDLTVKSDKSPCSLIINDKLKIQVSGSSLQWGGKRKTRQIWQFSIPVKRTFDLLIGVGIDEQKRPETISVFFSKFPRGRSIVVSRQGVSRYVDYHFYNFDRLVEILRKQSRKR